jgi:hypothetical protein
MTYSATLDFSSIFGPPRTCPGCGSHAIGIFDDLRDTLFRCRECGAHWRLTQGRTILEVATFGAASPGDGPETWTRP